MCGIAGFIDFTHSGTRDVLQQMTDTLAHRGPDDQGLWMRTVANAQIGLGHRRLSIIDLSSEAAQPMRRAGVSIVFNGEIYNHDELRDDLQRLGHAFTTRSDTEVLLHAFMEWGPSCVKRLIGMFAFVLIDEPHHKAYLFRDRAGVKPLYIYRTQRTMLFASELKALHRHPAFAADLDESAFSRYFDYGYVPGTQCVFTDTEKIAPGSWSEVDLRTGAVSSTTYWSIGEHYDSERAAIRYEEALEQFAALFHSACTYRMVSDVPVGLFLSGGYDSTAVLASLAQTSTEPIRAFTIGFETGNNEVPQAEQIAATIGCEHRTYICTEDDARRIIPELPLIYDEPFADSSAIPTVLVSRFAAQHVKVALSADGGDELLFGYTSYQNLGRRMAQLTRMPRRSRRLVAAAIGAISALMPPAFIRRRHMLEGLAAAIHSDDQRMAVQLHVIARQLPKTYQQALFAGFRQAAAEYELFSVADSQPLNEAAAWDFGHYLSGDILVKVDRATMSTSLEGREPFLDHRLAEFAARLPAHYKFNGATQKRVLRDFVHRYVPAEIMAGPKRGFSVPVLKWLRAELSYLIDEHLSAERLADSGFLRPEAITPLVRSFRQNRLHYSPIIWKLLMFQMWFARWKRGEAW